MTYYTDFYSIDEVLEVVESPRPAGAGTSSESNQPREEWDLGLGWDGALDAYTGGWAEGARKALDLADTLAPRPRMNRTTLSRSVTGAFPNVGAHLAGAPNAMYRVGKKSAHGRPYVHLFVPICYSASVNADAAFNRGCAFVALIDALENAGCRVKVTLTRTSNSNGSYCVRFMVKEYQDRLDIDQLVFTTAHPAFFRRIVFAVQERSEHYGPRRATTTGYGQSRDQVANDCPVSGNEVRVMFPTMTRDDNGKSAEKFLQEMVNGLPEDIRTEIDG